MEDMFEKCNDKWEQDVKLRLVEISKHTVSSDGRYHKDWKREPYLSFDKNGKKWEKPIIL